MSDCCSPDKQPSTHPKHLRCPANGKQCAAVQLRTIAHHLNKPWLKTLKSQAYYFCDDPACDVVYFGQDGSVIKTGELRTRVGQKETTPERTLCYCFGVTYQDAEQDPAIRDFVTTQTKQAACSCDTRNPSGRCCLKDFPLPHRQRTGEHD